ncbi:MAG: FecR family protein [Pseudomonadota bacterium]
MKIKIRRYQNLFVQIAVAALFLFNGNVLHAQSESIGNVLLVKGVATAASETRGLRTLAKNSEVFLMDTLQTASDSFLVIKMNDASKLTLRPGSEMLLEEFDQTPDQEKASFNLIKGGLRTLTGAIGAKNPEEFRVRTVVATIGVRGTDYIVRHCSKDCAAEEEALRSFQRVTSAPVGSNQPTRDKKLLQLDSRRNVVGQTPLDCKPVVEIRNGLYVAVLDGKIFIRRDDTQLNLEAIEAAFLDEKEIICLGEIPNFITLDDYLSDDPEGKISLYNFLQFINDEDQRCEVPEA